MNLFKREKNLGESVLTLRMWRFTGSAILNLVIFSLMAAYLSPLAYMAVTSLKDPKQATGLDVPWYPVRNPTYIYQGKEYSVMYVPTENGIKEWAIIKPRKTYTEFIDPQHPEKGPIHWEGNWYGLKKVYVFSLTVEAFKEWEKGDLPKGVLNTLLLAGISEIGVLTSSIAVAYGFSRFRIPGGKWLFFMLIATILIPDSITLFPTYLTYMKIIHKWLPSQHFLQLSSSFPWEWLPLLTPHFFSNAIFVFLLRQNFLGIPRDYDEAAMLDGAGPVQILTKIILPQSIPVVATVAMLQFFYIWNELRYVSLYLGANQNLWTLSARLQHGAPEPGINPEPSIQAGALLMIVVPVIVLFAFQRFFVKDMVVTGLEK